MTMETSEKTHETKACNMHPLSVSHNKCCLFSLSCSLTDCPSFVAILPAVSVVAVAEAVVVVAVVIVVVVLEVQLVVLPASASSVSCARCLALRW